MEDLRTKGSCREKGRLQGCELGRIEHSCGKQLDHGMPDLLGQQENSKVLKNLLPKKIAFGIVKNRKNKNKKKKEKSFFKKNINN